MSEPLLAVEHLVTSFATENGRLNAVDDVSFTIAKGETLGIVGESGCGKSVTALSIMRLLPHPIASLSGGRILFEGQDLAKISAKQMARIRGGRIGMIFQEPMKALNPVQSIGKQLSEVLLLHSGMNEVEALKRSVRLLERVGMPAAEKRMVEFPHQLSGGMRQRVIIAMAIARQPALLIADEPTTALDVTIQAQILNLFDDLQQENNTAVLMITHDFGVIAETCDRVLVMYAGEIVESGLTQQVLRHPTHPYTQGLLASIPQLATPPKQKLPIIPGQVPDLGSLQAGCRFQDRCPLVMDRCRTERPLIFKTPAGSLVRCFAATST